MRLKAAELSALCGGSLIYGSGENKLKLDYNRSYGSGSYEMPFEGIITNLQRRYDKPTSEYARSDLGRYINEVRCPKCHGARLNEMALSVYVGTKNIYEFTQMAITDAYEYINELKLDKMRQEIAELLLKDIKSRLRFLIDVGLGYLTLGEETPGLSGGEAQRLKLASEMNREQSDAVFVFDEPTIGLHPLDVESLLGVFQTLIDNGATVIIIEHDLDIIRNADYIIDMGPGGGNDGGRIVCTGTPAMIKANKESITGKYI